MANTSSVYEFQIGVSRPTGGLQEWNTDSDSNELSAGARLGIAVAFVLAAVAAAATVAAALAARRRQNKVKQESTKPVVVMGDAQEGAYPSSTTQGDEQGMEVWMPSSP